MLERMEWLKERQKGIFGSDAGSIMGVNKYKSAFEVYAEKTEEISEGQEEPEAVYWARKQRHLVSREFTMRTGKKTRKNSKFFQHRDYPFILGEGGTRVLGENSLLVCKFTSVFREKEWDMEEIPPSYLLQCQHNMAVTETEKCYFAVLIGGQKFICKELLRDEELISMMLEEERNFWVNHVEKRIPPELDGSSAAEKYLKEKFAKADKSLEVTLKDEYKERISDYLGLKESIRTLEEKAKAIENNLKNQLGAAERGIIGDYIVSWKGILSSRVDTKDLKSRYPQVYKDVCRESSSRRFEIKEGTSYGN
ncbi:MAG: lambda-exonuclease family protein [Clostridiaceae bacterium]